MKKTKKTLKENLVMMSRERAFLDSSDKGQIWISAVLYTLIAVVAIVFILQAGTPIIEGMRDRSIFTRTKNQFMTLDQTIEEVASLGPSSSRTIPIEIDKGKFYISGGELKWEFETAQKLVEPGSSQMLGNMIISSESNVKSSSNSTHFILENNKIRVALMKIGSKSSPAAIETDNIIDSVYFIETNSTIDGNFTFVVAGDSTTAAGTGYTEVLSTGNYLGSAAFIAHIDSLNYVYDLELTLDSSADFLKSRILNFEAK
ncbi:MAG: hypothetical protein ACLFPQ_02065 [Candidatus Woesearchaeota archaeon]